MRSFIIIGALQFIIMEKAFYEINQISIKRVGNFNKSIRATNINLISWIDPSRLFEKQRVFFPRPFVILYLFSFVLQFH